MRAGIALRPDYDAARLRGLAKATRNAGQSRRLLALAEIDDGGSRTKAARIGGVGLQTVRDWVVRFNARGPDGLSDGKAPGNARKLNDSQRQVLVNIVESGPMPAIQGVDPGRGLLAAEGSDPVDLGGIPDLAQRDDPDQPWLIMSIGLREWANA